MIRESNQAVFDSFLDFPKPILIAANGPAIGKYLDDRDDDDINGHDPGACVTSASTCDAIIASEKVTLKNNVFAWKDYTQSVKTVKVNFYCVFSLAAGDLHCPLRPARDPSRGLQQCPLWQVCHQCDD